MQTHIALDGPLNGQFITQDQAKENGYVLSLWQTGEEAYQHAPTQAEYEAEIEALG